MELRKINASPTTLDYKETIVVAGRGFSTRDVFDLEVVTSVGSANSELSLLEGFHTASYSECLKAYQGDLENFKDWPSQIKYPVEAALFDLSAPQGLNSEVYINGYFDPSNQSSIPSLECLKIKIGRDQFSNDKKNIQKVEDKRLRLDGNRKLDASTFEKFLPLVSHYDYFEEPFQDELLIKNYPNERFALDENVENIELQSLDQVVAFVLKPSLLGLDKTLQLIQEAKKLGKRVVISSTFEGEAGHKILGRIAAYADKELGVREVHGLGTITLLSNPLKHLGICVANDSASLKF